MDLEKRKFLKTIFWGGSLLFMSKVLGPILSFSKNSKISNEDVLENLKRVEEKDRVVFYDRAGTEVLVVEKV